MANTNDTTTQGTVAPETAATPPEIPDQTAHNAHAAVIELVKAVEHLYDLALVGGGLLDYGKVLKGYREAVQTAKIHLGLESPPAPPSDAQGV